MCVCVLCVQRAVDALVEYVKDQMKDPVQVLDDYYEITKTEVRFSYIVRLWMPSRNREGINTEFWLESAFIVDLVVP